MNPSDPPQVYAQVVERLRALPGARAEVVGDATGHPMWGAVLGSDADDRIDVLMTAGVHGDEPAGVEAALQFFEGEGRAYLDRFRVRLVPCVNPSGFEARTRVNGNDVDINRSITADDVPEAACLRSLVEGRRYALFLDLHEDYDATGFYMYEIERQNRLLGGRIVDAIKQIGPIDGDDNEDEGKDEEISEGLFAIQEKWRDQGWSAWAYYEGADHAVLTETPSTAWDLQRRVDAHHAALRLVLDHYRETTA